MSFTADELGPSGAASWSYQMVGRLKPGVTAQQAQEDAERVAQETMRNYPAFMASLRISAVVHSLHEETVQEARSLLRILFLAISVVMLIACANLAGLLLVRAIRQRREIAVRLALGAGKRALLRQADSGKPGAQPDRRRSRADCGGGRITDRRRSAAGNTAPRWRDRPRLESRGLRICCLAMLTGIVCGLAPAFAAIRTSVNETLKQGGRTGTRRWTCAFALRFGYRRNRHRAWCCWPPPACCCGALRRCARWSLASVPITP